MAAAALDDEIDSLLGAPADDTEIDDLLSAKPALPKAATKQPTWNDNPALTKVLDDYRKNNESNEALLAGFSLIPTMGLRKQIGQVGAAAMDKVMGSEMPFGELYDRARPQIEDYYSKKAEDFPLETMGGTVMGGLGMAGALNPISSRVAAKALPSFANKLATAGAAGVESGALSGVVGFNDSDAKGVEGKGYDALSQAFLGGAMGAGASLAPEALVSAASLAKRGVGKAMKLPAQIREMIGGGAKPAEAVASRADDFAQQMSDMLPKPVEAMPDNVVPIRPDQADIETKITPLKNFLRDQDGSMYMGGKGGAKDPEFLRKSQELADMLAQDADTAVSAVPLNPSIHEGASPNQIHGGKAYAEKHNLNPDVPLIDQAGAPHIKNKGFYRGEQHRFPTDRNARAPGDGEWAPGEWEDATKPQGGFDWFSDANDDAINELLNRGEFGRARQRHALDVDSSAGRVPKQAEAPAFEGKATNAGAGDMYEPMGVQAAARTETPANTMMTSKPDWFDQVERMGGSRPDAPMTDDMFAQIEAQVNAQGGANLQDVPWQRSALKPRDPIELPPDQFADQTAMSKRPSMMPRDPIEVPGWQGIQGPQAPANNQAAAAKGRERVEKIGGVLGGAAGTYHAGPLGAWPGYKAGQATAKGANKAIDMAANFGAKLDRSPEQMAQQMAKDPAMLQKIASSGGPMAGAAKFILQGAEEAGEIGLRARAFVAAAMPGYRELFAQEEP